jgi:hypothetical protein
MDTPPLPAVEPDVLHSPLVRGSRVHVSDASPRGFCGRVTAVHPGALTVERDDRDAWELVLLSRRHVVALTGERGNLPAAGDQPPVGTFWQGVGADAILNEEHFR